MKKLLLTLGAIASVAAPVAAVVACDSTPAAKHVDEGFNNASLIENFNIADEEVTTKELTGYYLDGIKYDESKPNDIKNFVEAWAESANKDGFMGRLASVPSMSVYSTLKLAAKVDGGIIKLSLVDAVTGKPSPINGTDAEAADITKFKTAAHQLVDTVPGYQDWATAHSLITGETKKVATAPKKTDSIDAILYTQANKLTKHINVEHDTISIESKNSIYKRADQTMDLSPLPAASFDVNQPLAAEFKEGDSIIFSFDRKEDISSFTQRVKYVDTLDGTKVTFKDFDSIKNQELNVIDGKVTAIIDISGNVQKMFTLEPVANNSIKLTFGKMTHKKIEQWFVLSAFQDVNKDGIINSKDKSATNQFTYAFPTIDKIYLDKDRINKDTFISGYQEAKAFLDSVK